MDLILGSASPRRRDLLAQIGIVPKAVQPADIDETVFKDELPRAYVMRMAQSKATAISIRENQVVLCADTIVSVGRQILGKPADQVQAIAYLQKLSGRKHNVATAVAVRTNEKTWLKIVTTKVAFKRLSDQEIGEYIESKEWQGKAGGYAIQGIAAAMIPSIHGSYSNVVGLPLAETANLLRAAGLPVTLSGAA